MKDLREGCGVFGIAGHPDAARMTCLGLHALQHRGQESAGIVSSDNERLFGHRAMGLVGDIFNAGNLGELKGFNAIGHVRYSTFGGSLLKNVQPFWVDYAHGSLAVAHNGNLINGAALRTALEKRGSIFQSSMDTEAIVHLIAQADEPDLPHRIMRALEMIPASYSLLFLSERQMVAARDPYGVRPLVLGQLDGSYVVASETSAFDLIDAHYLREIEPGEILLIQGGMLTSFRLPQASREARCIFEMIYFARPDSFVFGRNVNEVRRAMGRALARRDSTEADMVIPVPDSGVPGAIGYAEEAGIPFEMGLIRSHYVGRTFIEPVQSIRNFGVKLKLNAVKESIRGKRVVLVDDSIIRGTTSQKIVTMVRNAGASEVHIRITAPPTTHPCYYGIDTPTKDELIASNKTVEEIRQYLHCDSLRYLNINDLNSAVGVAPRVFCHACFTGDYPAGDPGEYNTL